MEGNGGMNRGTSGAMKGGMNENIKECMCGYIVGVVNGVRMEPCMKP